MIDLIWEINWFDRLIVMAVAVMMEIVVLMMPDDSQGPGKVPSFITFAFSAIKKDA